MEIGELIRYYLFPISISGYNFNKTTPFFINNQKFKQSPRKSLIR